MKSHEKIIKGMQLIQAGCEEVEDCKDCPFEKICEASCYQSGIPANWIIKEV